jgi:cyclophilin family peptidyl-prolyl cis-trans isomerase
VALRTSEGTVVLRLFGSDAPLTAASFVDLVSRGYFDGVSFHRVVPNFVVQGGDPRGDGNGGPGYQIRCEINTRRYGRGSLGMALSGKDTGGSQFFITHTPQPHLDGGYTVFGEVVEGMDVVDRITQGQLILEARVIEEER